MKLKSGVVCAAVVAAAILSGCSSEPTAADIKDNYKQVFKDCPVMKIGDVKKLNGRPAEGKDYIVDASLTIILDPPKENAALIEQNKKEYEALIPQIESLRERHQEMIKTAEELEAAEAQTPFNSPERDAAMERTNAARKIRGQLNSQYYELTMRQKNLLPDSQYVMRKMAENIRKQCSMPNAWRSLSRLEDFIVFVPNEKSLYTETQKTYTGQFHMVKTEKGWMMSDMLRQ